MTPLSSPIRPDFNVAYEACYPCWEPSSTQDPDEEQDVEDSEQIKKEV